MTSSKQSSSFPRSLIDRPSVDLPALRKHDVSASARTWGQAKLDSLPISSLNVYVDGSMLEDGSVGAGIFLDYDGTIINRFYKLTGGAHSAYQGELVAILLAIRLVQELEIPDLRPFLIVSDCQLAIQASMSP